MRNDPESKFEVINQDIKEILAEQDQLHEQLDSIQLKNMIEDLRKNQFFELNTMIHSTVNRIQLVADKEHKLSNNLHSLSGCLIKMGILLFYTMKEAITGLELRFLSQK